MPLLRFDIVQGRTKEEISTLLDAAHEAMVEAFDVPIRDRYQILHEHPPEQFAMQDTGLGISRTERRVLVQVTTRPRSRDMKETFYRLLCERLHVRCGIKPTDVVISMVTNTDEDWSFGHGRAQFLTGEL